MISLKINKNSIPYITPIIIGENSFYIEFKYNLYDERIYINLYDNENNLLYPSEPILYGIPLWHNKLIGQNGNTNKKYPQAWIIPNTIDRTIEKITYENIEKVELIIQEF